MAQIDLRNAVVRIKDGYTGPGGSPTVNAPAYPIGATTMVVDGFTGALSNNDRFTIAGDSTIYTVSSHVETLGNTTSVTFTPALVVAADDNAVITAYQPNADDLLINNGAGYTSGSSVLAVDGFTGAVATGDKIKFSGHATLYTITAHSETLGNTTSITVSPVLTSNVSDNETSIVYEPNGDTLLVNHVGTYSASAVTMRVTGFSGALADFDYFTIGSSDTLYEVTSHSETLGNTTSVTFTPGLDGTVTTGDVIHVAPHQIEVLLGDGNLMYDEKRSYKYIRNRGRLSSVRREQDEPVEISMDATWEFVRGASSDPPTIEDALKNRGQASGWITSASDTCEKYSVDVEIEYTPPCSGAKREIVTLSDFRYESLNHDLKMGTFAIKGKANVVEASVVRIT